MTVLLSTGQAEELALYSDTYETKDALDAEGKMRIYEALAGYHYLHLNQPRQAQRYLYWEEALAKEYGLERRIHVVHMLLEEIANALGEVPTLEVLKQEGLEQTQEKQLRQRYDSILSTSNEAAAQVLFEQKQLSLAELKLVRALNTYNTALEGKAKFTVALRLIENDMPEQNEASFYWALLMLQLKSKIGSLNHPSETRFLLQTLKESTTSQQNILFSLPVAARLFPLGLSIAAYVIKELQAGLKFVAIIWDEQEKDGIRQAGQKLASISPRVRQAIIQDGLNANNKEYQSIISSKTGHTMNKKRFEESLEKANLSKQEVTDIGSIARALQLLSQHNANAEKSLEKLQEESLYLKKTVPIL